MEKTMPIFRRLRPYMTRIRGIMPYLFEFALVLTTFKVAWTMLTDQEYFDRNPHAYAYLVEHITHDEWELGVLALVSALFMCTGLVFLSRRSSERAADVAFITRTIGWAGSSVLWTLLGITQWVNQAGSLGSWNALLVAALAVGVCVSGPAMPDGDDS